MNVNTISSINCTPIRRNNPNIQNTSFGNVALTKAYSSFTDRLAVGMSKVLNSESVIKFSEKFHNTNIADYIFKASGVLLSSFVMIKTLKSDKIEESRKKPLALNTGLSCAVATASGLYVDKLLEKPVEKFIKSFKTANINVKNMDRLIDGIKVTKSALLFGTIYRFIVPVLATIAAEKIINTQGDKQQANSIKTNA